jgi:hypothetical protein
MFKTFRNRTTYGWIYQNPTTFWKSVFFRFFFRQKVQKALENVFGQKKVGLLWWNLWDLGPSFGTPTVILHVFNSRSFRFFSAVSWQSSRKRCWPKKRTLLGLYFWVISRFSRIYGLLFQIFNRYRFFLVFVIRCFLLRSRTNSNQVHDFSIIHHIRTSPIGLL